MTKIFKNQKGFTLIEMLVVIAIISILIGIGINTFTIAQKKARDVRRKADLRNIQTALELYKGDNGVYYVVAAGDTFRASGGNLTSGTSFVKNYLSDKIPLDPSPNKAYYYISANGTTYTLAAILENTQDPNYVLNCITNYNYCVSPQ